MSHRVAVPEGIVGNAMYKVLGQRPRGYQQEVFEMATQRNVSFCHCALCAAFKLEVCCNKSKYETSFIGCTRLEDPEYCSSVF